MLASILGTALILKSRGEKDYLFATIFVLIQPINLSSFKSLQFQIWMLGCTILSTYYLGDLSSEMISPTQEMHLTTFDELIENNYSLLYNSQLYKRRVWENVASSPEFWNHTGNLGAKILTLLDTAKVTKSEKDFLGSFVIADKTALVANWMVAMGFAQKGNHFIDKHGAEQERGCYVGKELRLHTNFWYSLSGRHKERMGRKFRHMFEAGFLHVWLEASKAVTVVSRVQDRE